MHTKCLRQTANYSQNKIKMGAIESRKENWTTFAANKWFSNANVQILSDIIWIKYTLM